MEICKRAGGKLCGVCRGVCCGVPSSLNDRLIRKYPVDWEKISVGIYDSSQRRTRISINRVTEICVDAWVEDTFRNLRRVDRVTCWGWLSLAGIGNGEVFGELAAQGDEKC